MASSSKGDFIVASKYRLIRKIGSGSFGDIYLGINITNGEVSLCYAFLCKQFPHPPRRKSPSNSSRLALVIRSFCTKAKCTKYCKAVSAFRTFGKHFFPPSSKRNSTHHQSAAGMAPSVNTTSLSWTCSVPHLRTSSISAHGGENCFFRHSPL